jgi:hypothetical protein
MKTTAKRHFSARSGGPIIAFDVAVIPATADTWRNR